MGGFQGSEWAERASASKWQMLTTAQMAAAGPGQPAPEGADSMAGAAGVLR